jgi:surfactin family lipopeptide synthetase A
MARQSNQTDADYPRHVCLPQLLEDSFAQNPHATAVECLGQSLTYAELDVRSNQLARLLLRKGAGPDLLVGLCVERSVEMVVALLGILKAGAAYVPLDPSYPSDRIKYVLDDARVKILVMQAGLITSLPPTPAYIVNVDPDRREFHSEDPGPVTTGITSDNLAYVIYTSGSTGRPKGVQLEHRSIVNFLCSIRRNPGMTANDVLVAVTTLSFDIAGLEIYLPLLVGGKLVVASREVAMDGHLLRKLLQQSAATIMQATPTTWRVLLESGWEGDSKLKVLVGGEALPADLARQLSRCCSSVWNMYGPTETTIWSSVYKVEGDEAKLVPIGKPIANTTFHILDENRQSVPDGAEGELYIGGDGLARGYFERDALTAERFVHDPFSSIPAARMYRTGDLARYKQDGNVEFLGRLDHQVKVRGFRIELGEIEAVLGQQNGLNQAVVIAREDTPGDKRLVAYIVPSAPNSVTSAALREHAEHRLPDYMIPSAFVQMPMLPLTPNGKVDRKALPAPTPRDFELESTYVAPRNATERKLVSLWEDVLGVRPISVTTSFFDLGGRSLLAARLFTRILRTFGKELPLSILFRSPTVELLANELRPAQSSAQYPTLITIQPEGTRPPFFCVHGGAGSTLFLHRLSRRLGTDFPFYSIEPEGMDGKKLEHRSVEEMAVHYLAQIRKVQPHGPYYLGGYCFGGIVAFEMARILQAQGEPPALVALFSAALRFNHAVPQLAVQPPPRPFGARAATALSSPIKTVTDRSRTAYWWFLPVLRTSIYKSLFGLGLRVPPDMRTMYVAQTLGQAERAYKPKPYLGSLVLFYGPGTLDFGPNLGWDGLAEHFEHYVIGDGILDSRRDIMNEPLVDITGKELASLIIGERGAHSLPAPLTAN